MSEEFVTQTEETAKDTYETPKSGGVGAYLFGLLVFLVMTVASAIVSVIGTMPLQQRAILASGGDPAKAQELILAEMANSPLVPITQFFASFIMLVIGALWYFFKFYKPARDEGRVTPVLPKIMNLKAILLIVFGTMSAYSLAVLLQYGMTLLLPEYASNVNTVLSGALSGVIGVLAGIIVAPMAEEIAVRGLILRRAEKSFGLVGCMIISAVMFALFHLNLIQSVYVIPMGLFWGYIGYKYKSVIPCIICHLINNLIAVLISSFADGISVSNAMIFAGLFIVCGVITFFAIKMPEKETA
ncbi:MAG: CPBP family intramembrane metalloprotease [Lachnospiraceae bacterium]|nr:CPBP family intramembrane metalloprotease [Lachnospiraceae bacterium]